MEDANKTLFLAIGLDPKVVDSTLKNKKVTQRLKEVIELAGIKEANKTIGNLLYGVATKMPETTFHHTKFFIDQVLTEKIVRPLQLDEGIKYVAEVVRKQGAEAKINAEEFSKEAGIGINVTDEEIAETVGKIFAESDALIKEHGHSFDFAKIIYKAREHLKWAD
jgi:glutaminyl-tRNA synthetase